MRDMGAVGGRGGIGFANFALTEFPLSSDTTLGPSDMMRFLYVNCSSASNLTLPAPDYNTWVFVYNCGGASIGVRNDTGTLIGTIFPDQWARLYTKLNSSGSPAWPGAFSVFSNGGRIFHPGRVLISTSSEGFVLKAPDGNYWEILVSNTGVLTTTNLGSSLSGLA